MSDTYSSLLGMVVAILEATLNSRQRVRNRQETVNKRFKNWAILAVPYRHKLLDHQSVFCAIVALTQLSFVENPLFQVDYDDV